MTAPVRVEAVTVREPDRRRLDVVAWLLGPPHALTGVAVARVLVGTAALGSLLVNLPVRHYVWGTGARWARTWPDDDAWGWPVTVLGPDLPRAGFDVLYAAALLAAAAFLLGWRTRWSGVALLVLGSAVLRLDPLAADAGDDVARITLVYLCLARSGARWSLDARRARRREVRGHDAAGTEGVPDGWVGTLVHNLAVALLVFQACLIYLVAGLTKLVGSTWLGGTAVAYALGDHRYAPWPALNELVVSLPGVVVAASVGSVALQVLFPVLLLWRPTRALVLAAAVSMHVGIAVLLGLPFFSLAMLSLDAVLVRDATYARAGHLARAALRRVASWRPAAR
ncbi:HTTM domain-containing protein [Cellulomonas sp. NPDC055163]